MRDRPRKGNLRKEAQMGVSKAKSEHDKVLKGTKYKDIEID